MQVFINQPGDYSGDSWHIAAVLALTNEINVLQTISNHIEKSELRATQAKSFYLNFTAIKRIHEISFPENLYDGLPMPQINAKLEYLKRNEVIAEEFLKSELHIQSKVLRIYQSTSIFMKQMEFFGRSKVIKILQNSFTKDFELYYADAARIIVKLIESIPQKSILMNARFAKYSTGNNLNLEKYEQIRDIIGERPKILAVGDISSLKFDDHFKSMFDNLIDIYNIHESVNNVDDTGFINMQSTAYFWKKLFDSSKSVTIIGGRSGSLDAAAFMGNRVIAWDDLNPNDPESARHIIQAPGLLSVFNLSNRNHSYLTDNGTRLSEYTPAAALELFFNGMNIRPVFDTKIIETIIAKDNLPENIVNYIYNNKDNT